jgi:hypothetical protein
VEVIVLFAFAVFLGFFTIALIRKPPAYLPMRGAGHPDIDEHLAATLGNLTIAEFEGMVRRLVNDYIGLEIDVVDRVAENEVEIRAKDPKPMVGGLYIVHGVLRRLDDYIGPEVVMQLKDVVKEEGALKGVLVTNGIFAAPAAQMLDAQKLELINGPTLLKMIGAPDPRPA